MTEPIKVDSTSFASEVLESETPVLVDFWAQWCGPCRMIAPVLTEMAQEHADKLKVAKVDIDANPDLARQFGVMSIPTLKLFRKGAVADTIIGFMSRPQLESRVLAKL